MNCGARRKLLLLRNYSPFSGVLLQLSEFLPIIRRRIFSWVVLYKGVYEDNDEGFIYKQNQKKKKKLNLEHLYRKITYTQNFILRNDEQEVAKKIWNQLTSYFKKFSLWAGAKHRARVLISGNQWSNLMYGLKCGWNPAQATVVAQMKAKFDQVTQPIKTTNRKKIQHPVQFPTSSSRSRKEQSTALRKISRESKEIRRNLSNFNQTW